MKDFWTSSGYHLLDRGPGGGLVITDDFLRLYLARPEIAPPDTACAAERALHASLLAAPRRKVAAREVTGIEDDDARENWEALLSFRDRLLQHPSLEAAYLALMRQRVRRTPALFVDQLVHVILRNALDGCTDPYLLRAAELFFREQRLTVHDGALIAADEETIAGIGDTPLSPLASVLGLPAAGRIDVMDAGNAATYWERSDRFDMALDLTAGSRGLAALGEVMGQWVLHMLAVEVDVEPLTEVHDVNLVWYVGLDIDGTHIGDALWNGEELDEVTRSRVVGLYRLTFHHPQLVTEEVRGEPVYLILAMTPDSALRMRPQNLLTGLPIRHLEAVS